MALYSFTRRLPTNSQKGTNTIGQKQPQTGVFLVGFNIPRILSLQGGFFFCIQEIEFNLKSINIGFSTLRGPVRCSEGDRRLEYNRVNHGASLGGLLSCFDMLCFYKIFACAGMFID